MYWMLKIENQAKTRVKCVFSSTIYRMCIHLENPFIIIPTFIFEWNQCRKFEFIKFNRTYAPAAIWLPIISTHLSFSNKLSFFIPNWLTHLMSKILSFVILHRSINYHGESNFSALFTPTTFLISYFNSAFNPLLYAFLSRNFRKGMREIILCSFKRNNNNAIQQRIPLHVSKSVFWQIFSFQTFQTNQCRNIMRTTYNWIRSIDSAVC